MNSFFSSRVFSFRLRSVAVLIALSLLGAVARAQAPTITAISAPRQVVTLGQNLTLSVTGAGATSYQWKRNGLALSGANSANYTITGAVPVRDNGWYQAIVTNTAGSTTSAVVFVNVAVNPASVAAWGSNFSGQTTVPAGLANVVAIASGTHSLALNPTARWLRGATTTMVKRRCRPD